MAAALAPLAPSAGAALRYAAAHPEVLSSWASSLPALTSSVSSSVAAAVPYWRSRQTTARDDFSTLAIPKDVLCIPIGPAGVEVCMNEERARNILRLASRDNVERARQLIRFIQDSVLPDLRILYNSRVPVQQAWRAFEQSLQSQDPSASSALQRLERQSLATVRRFAL